MTHIIVTSHKLQRCKATTNLLLLCFEFNIIRTHAHLTNIRLKTRPLACGLWGEDVSNFSHQSQIMSKVKGRVTVELRIW